MEEAGALRRRSVASPGASGRLCLQSLCRVDEGAGRRTLGMEGEAGGSLLLIEWLGQD